MEHTRPPVEYALSKKKPNRRTINEDIGRHKKYVQINIARLLFCLFSVKMFYGTEIVLGNRN